MQIYDMSDDELRKLASKYEIENARTMKRTELEDAVQLAITKRQMRLEEKARAERILELKALKGLDPLAKKNPAPETIEISNSPKIYCIFRNLEEKDTDVEFNWGCTHNFHLWDGYIHVMPKCVIEKLENHKNPIGKRPRYAMRPHTSIPNLTLATIIGHESRFDFKVLGEEPPKNAEFGVVLNRKIYDKLGVPFPEPVAHAV